MALWAVRIRRDNVQDQTGHRPVATALEIVGTIENGQRRKIDNNKLNTMLRMMQVTMGK
jgi:hypothetical protein